MSACNINNFLTFAISKYTFSLPGAAYWSHRYECTDPTDQYLQ